MSEQVSSPPQAQASLPLASSPVAQTTPAAEPAPVAAPKAAAAPGKPSLPKVQAYELPIQDLVQVASNSGLQWVNSDADKIAQVQAAIAAEPKPAHVPRERPAPVQLDAGPLILVETRRDLRNMELPFEASQPKG